MTTTRFSGGHLLFALGVFTFATTLYAVCRHYSPLPFSDQWDGMIGFYMRALQNPWHSFFEQHNEHRLTFSRLIFFPDVRYFGGRNLLSLAANLVLAVLLALAFYRVTCRYSSLDRAMRLSLLGVILVFTFSWIQEENFTWGFQSQWFAVYLFALLAFHALDLTARAQARGDAAKSLAWLIAALASGTVSAFSMSSGVLVLPVLIAQAIYQRLKLHAILLALAVTATVWIGYFVDWHKPASSGNFVAALREHPIIAGSYVLLYLGAPAQKAHLGYLGAYVTGALVLFTLIAFCAKLLRHPNHPVRAIALLCVTVFIAGNALVTASGRLGFGVESALSSRYTTASLAAWLALILFAALNVETVDKRRAVFTLAVVATGLIVYAQRSAFNDAHDVTHSRLVAGLALRSHVYDPQIVTAVYPFPETLVNIAKAAEEAQVSIFAPGQPDYLVPPQRIDSKSPCDGAIDGVFLTSNPNMLRATGWIYDSNGQSTPRFVVVTDGSNATLGTGVTGGPRPDARAHEGRRARYSGWTAFFKAPPTGEIHIAARTADGRYCAMKATGTMPLASSPASH
ncbi:hypothetical protein [Paraburkholderia diazotrophica]|uniref:Transmembrane protein n=1 Tax=Paraburkholderia diazotrophica TaxID=667676 RepID=A0A1H7DL20_9BURK|nr:hypothetical protein [Paraburkholderia diazotrophica]SEK02288.1 hypothetical protein SAMN05192539_103148 [Paraburkholderia diazotrophica]